MTRPSVPGLRRIVQPRRPAEGKDMVTDIIALIWSFIFLLFALILTIKLLRR